MKKNEMTFLYSAMQTDSEVSPNVLIRSWIHQRRDSVNTQVKIISLNSMRGWHRQDFTGNVVHESGRFFAIEGISIKTNWGTISHWEQPIINQPEIGYLGMLGKKIGGVLHLLVQAKIEPGNINIVQISPTLQATKSNYSRVHQGNAPRYLEYFNGSKHVKILLDQLQSEQGARFLRKRNRNMIVEVPEDEVIQPHPDFMWMTIGQIKLFMTNDNIINMDTRTVLSGISYGSYTSDVLSLLFTLAPVDQRKQLILKSTLDANKSLNAFIDIISWLSFLKSKYELVVERIGLDKISDWKLVDGRLERPDKKYFAVIGVSVLIENREVISWDQPMVMPSQEGLAAFIVKSVNGTYHFLVQAKLEAGNFDIVELAPTVQCLTGNYRTGENEYSVKYIDQVLAAPPERILYDSMQSEEGGRFFQEQNRNMIVEVDDDFPLAVDENYCWMTLNQMLRFIEFNNYLNIAARSLIASVNFA